MAPCSESVIVQCICIYVYAACVVTHARSRQESHTWWPDILPLSVCLSIAKKGASWYSTGITLVYSVVTMETSHTSDCNL